LPAYTVHTLLIVCDQVHSTDNAKGKQQGMQLAGKLKRLLSTYRDYRNMGLGYLLHQLQSLCIGHYQLSL